MIMEAHRALKKSWLCEVRKLRREARSGLRLVLLELSASARAKSKHAWRKRKGPMAIYHRVAGVYAALLARTLRPYVGRGTPRTRRGTSIDKPATGVGVAAGRSVDPIEESRSRQTMARSSRRLARRCAIGASLDVEGGAPCPCPCG